MKNTAENVSKAHKYNVGDEFVIKVAAVREESGKAVYDIEGIENMSFTEKTLEKFVMYRSVKPGDIIYCVSKADWDECEKICFDAYRVEDISDEEVKICSDWQAKDETIFFDEKTAGRKAQELAEEFGLPIEKGGLFAKEVQDGRP